MKFLRTTALALLAAGLPLAACAQAPALTTFPVGTTTVTASALATNLDHVWELVWGPDNFIWMTERGGRISRVNPATGQVLPLLTVPDVTPHRRKRPAGHGRCTRTLPPRPYVFVVYNYTDAGSLKEKAGALHLLRRRRHLSSAAGAARQHSGHHHAQRLAPAHPARPHPAHDHRRRPAAARSPEPAPRSTAKFCA